MIPYVQIPQRFLQLTPENYVLKSKAAKSPCKTPFRIFTYSRRRMNITHMSKFEYNIIVNIRIHSIDLIKRRYTYMSKKRQHNELSFSNGFGIGGMKPTLPSIIILILIILQFSNHHGSDENLSGFNGIDNGILFIIAIFYLSCLNH